MENEFSRIEVRFSVPGPFHQPNILNTSLTVLGAISPPETAQELRSIRKLDDSQESQESHRKHSDSLGPNQVCTFFGATPGETVISGAAYISQAYAYDVENIYKVNVSALLGFLVFFIVAQIVALEVIHVCSIFTSCSR
jgi:hypothetical protein